MLTIVSYIRNSMGNKYRVLGFLNYGVYTTGGLFLDKTQINLNFNIEDVSIDPFLGSDGNVYTFTWDETNQKIIICGPNGGGGGLPTGTISQNSAGTPAGSISTPSFTGSPLGTHSHEFTGSSLAPHGHTFTGSPLSAHNHTFNGSSMSAHGHSIIPHADDTATVTANEIDFSASPIKPIIFNYVYAIAGGITGPLQLIPPGSALSSGQCRYTGANILQFFAGDAITTAALSWLHGGVDTTSAGTPSGTISSDSAGTPTGTNSTTSGGTPTGELSDDSAGTPAGSISTPSFTGSPLGTHNHTFTGTGGGGGSFGEIANGTNLSAILQGVAFEAIGL